MGKKRKSKGSASSSDNSCAQDNEAMRMAEDIDSLSIMEKLESITNERWL